MFLKITWDQEFDNLMMHLWSRYGRDIFSENGIGDQLDLNKFSRNFFKNTGATADISIDGNSNVTGKSIIDYNFEFSKPLLRYNSHFLLWKELRKNWGLLKANEILEKQITGEIYINDFGDISRPYCFNFSCYDIALLGLPMTKRMKIKPPNSLESFIRQMEQFVVYAANSTLGATGIADIFIVASHFIDKIIETGYDGHIKICNNTKKEFSKKLKIYVSEKIRSFIYTLNWEFRGNQSPFSNCSIYDSHFLKSLVKDYIFEEGSPNINTIKQTQKIFIEAMNEELKRTNLTFPITTACFKVEDGIIKDEKFLKYIAEQNLEYGFINFYYGSTSTLSSCCRLRSDKNNEFFSSFGAGSTKIGSLGVVTINFPRLAYLAKKTKNPQEHFLNDLKKSVEICAQINHAKRNIIKKRIELNSMPLYSLGFMNIKKQYSTCGVNGLSESLEISGYDITTKKGEMFVLEILDIINAENDKMEKRFKFPHNCEQTPSESSAVKLAKRDRMLKYQDEYVIYSNQFIPLTTSIDMLERLRIQGIFDNKFSGGAICHINLAYEVTDPQKMIDLMKYAAKTGTIYWAINYAIKRCINRHAWVDGDICPICGDEIDQIITRVVGFFTVVENFNKVRREIEFPKRVFYGEK